MTTDHKAQVEAARALIDECRSALAEELAGWDIDPPLHHVKQAHDRCINWLAALASAPPAPAASEPVASSMVGVGTDKPRDDYASKSSPSILLDALATPQPPAASSDALDAARYRKLRKLMTHNLPETWERVCRVAAVGSWEDFDAFLDSDSGEVDAAIKGEQLPPAASEGVMTLTCRECGWVDKVYAGSLSAKSCPKCHTAHQRS